MIASSDHFSTHISYALVYTADPTRQGILDAIRKRHTYGATDNIILDVRMGDHFMGDEFKLQKAEPIRVKVRGHEAGGVGGDAEGRQSDLLDAAEGAGSGLPVHGHGRRSQRHYYYVRLQQDDRMTAWSSPFFVNYR